jgi:hypothetical protein
LKCLKGGSEIIAQELSSSGRTLVHFTEVIKEEASGGNSPWRTHEVARTVGSRGVARWIRIGRTHHFGIRNQRGPLIVIRCESSRSFRGFGVRKSGVQAKILGHSNSQSREGLLSVEFQDFGNSGFRIPKS